MNMMESTATKVELSGTASLRGKVSYAKGSQKPIYTFLGVPYAQPPTGHLRFAPPGQLQLWEGERQAVEFGPTCPQSMDGYKLIPKSLVVMQEVPTNISEDCLFVNIWTPTLASAAKLPVMFWIHGGGYNSGNGDVYEGTSLATFEDVVLVSINYRVGPLGFLNIGDDAAQGNFGLLDQVEGLCWMQKYINKFGGDPSNVTIFGESAGGMSVSVLMHSPLTDGLFRRAISHSGTILAPGFLLDPEKQAEYVKTKAKEMGCDSTTSEDVIAYLRNRTPEELLKGFKSSQFMPVIDGHVITGPSFTLYKTLNKSSAVSQGPAGLRADYMLGHNSHEGALLVGFFLKMLSLKLTTMETVKGYIKVAVLSQVASEDDMDRLITEAIDLYFNGAVYGDEEDLMKRMVAFHSDFLFVAANELSAILHSENSKTYVYYFNQRPSSADRFDVPKWVTSDHASEIVFALGLPLSNDITQFTPEEENLSRLMMKYWANFAKTGNPDGTSGPSWLQYSKNKPQRMVLSTDTKMVPSLQDVAPSCTPEKLAFFKQFMLGHETSDS